MNTAGTKTIYLIRHGQTYGNAQGNWIGQYSQDKLNEYGRKQMRDAIDTLKALNVYTQCVYSSPTTRALESAEIIQRHFGLPISIKKLNSLSEINLGILEDKTRNEGQELLPQEIEDWETNIKKFNPPLGESAVEALERFSEIVELIAKNCTEQNIVIVTHGVVLKLLLAQILQKSIETGEPHIDVPLTRHGSITVLAYDDQGFRFKKVIENRYPDSELVTSMG